MSSDDTCDSDSYDEERIIRNFEAEGQLIANNLLPPKSSARFDQVYETFMKWKVENKANEIKENMLLIYFNELSIKLKPSTLWSTWSMLKTTLNLRNNIDIDKYILLKNFLKNKSKGFKAKKSPVLTWAQINQFLQESDDYFYLCMKAVLIFGIFRALRSQEFVNINITDVEDTSTQYIVTIKDTKNYYPRNFIIGAEYYNIINKYIALRPDGMDTGRLFINYQKGKCTRQVMGKKKIIEIPKTLYLNIENAENFTGHCFRRTAAILLVNSGANLTMVKQLGGCRSGGVAEGCIENSIQNRSNIFEKIISSNKPLVSKKNAINISTETEIAAIPSTSKENAHEVLSSSNDLPPVNSNVLISYNSKPNAARSSTPEIHQHSTKQIKRIPFENIQNLNSDAPSSKKVKHVKKNIHEHDIENVIKKYLGKQTFRRA